MLNRRKAILAASSSLLIAEQARVTPFEVCTIPEGLSEKLSGSVQTVANACLECAAICDNLAVLPGSTHQLAADCKDICTVTATLLSRSGPMAPAICQACADACTRLAVAFGKTTATPTLQNFRRVAQNCAKVCDLHVSRNT